MEQEALLRCAPGVRETEAELGLGRGVLQQVVARVKERPTAAAAIHPLLRHDRRPWDQANMLCNIPGRILWPSQ